MHREALAEALAETRRRGAVPAPALLLELRRMLCRELAAAPAPPNTAADARALLFWLGELLLAAADRRTGWLCLADCGAPLPCRAGSRMLAHALLCLVGVLSPGRQERLLLETRPLGRGALLILRVEGNPKAPLPLCSLRWHCCRLFAEHMGGRLLACRGKDKRGAALWLPGESAKKIEKPPELFDFLADRCSPLYLLATGLCVPPDDA